VDPAAAARERLRLLGEDEAARELAELGYRILARNYRCRGGEADLVAEDGETLVFVEVKARSSLRHGLPREAVGWRKQQRLKSAAERYLHDHPEAEERPVRFDVVEVVVLNGRVAVVEVLRDAFVPD
jgi:putative endonuclease